jgi:hypothetical protein
MIKIRSTKAVAGITSQEIRQLIAEITEGQLYEADMYGEFFVVVVEGTLPEI